MAGGGGQPSESVELEIDLNADSYGNRLAVFHRRFKFPFFYCFDCLFVQPQTQGTLYPYVTRKTVCPYYHPKDTDTFKFRVTCLLGILRIRAVNRRRGSYPLTNLVNSFDFVIALRNGDTNV